MTPEYTRFLDNVLSQGGPSSLNYPEDTKGLIRQHLLSLLESHASFQPHTAHFTHSDGETVNLLQADGTIPTVYQNFAYNIPIVIWFMESYPHHPPCVYVTPPSNMIIKKPHPHVKPLGLVSIPYLHSWAHPSSNLVDLVRNLSDLFGRDLPFHTRQQSNPREGVNEGMSSLSPPYGWRNPQLHPNEVYKKRAVNKLSEILVEDLGKLRESSEEMEGLSSVQTILRQRRELFLKEISERTEEKEELEQQLQMVLMKTEILEAWTRMNEEQEVGKKGNLDVDNLLEHGDVLTKQISECIASDLAIDDVVYSLERAFENGSLTLSQYLKQVIKLSREQFIHRANCEKLREVRRQSDV